MKPAEKIKILKELALKKTLELEAIQNEIEKLEKELLSKEKKQAGTQQNPDEILKEIEGYPRFFINRKGQVFHEAGMEMPIIKKDTGNFVKLFDQNNTKSEVPLAKLVAKSWVDGESCSGEVEHLDGNIHNDHADNLKWK